MTARKRADDDTVVSLVSPLKERERERERLHSTRGKSVISGRHEN
jgi:hypothetical protein